MNQENLPSHALTTESIDPSEILSFGNQRGHPATVFDSAPFSTGQFYQEPPHLNFNQNETALDFTIDNSNQEVANVQPSDSGYGSLSQNCDCQCHQSSHNPSVASFPRPQDTQGDSSPIDLSQKQNCLFCSSRHAQHDSIQRTRSFFEDLDERENNFHWHNLFYDRD